MKTKSNIIYKLLIIISFLFINTQNSVSQTFSGNIQIPGTDEGGIFIGDIFKAENYFFVYSLNKLVVYDDNGIYVDEILFNNTHTYGKFNPIFFWDSHYTSFKSLMTLNDDDPNNPLLYLITPNLDICIVDLNSLSGTTSTCLHTPQPLGNPNLGQFIPLHGNCILKYDKSHERLYWVIDGQHESENAAGSFHVRQRYLFIFDIDNNISWQNQNHITTYYSDHIYSNTNNYEDAGILDIEINENNSTTQEDYFYLSKINSIEVWRIDPSASTEVKKIHTLKTYNLEGNSNNYGCNYYKMGLKYIKDDINGIHKLIAFPYRFPSCTGLADPEILMLDGNHGSTIEDEDWVRILSPADKITDVEYLSYYHHLVLTHSSDPANSHLSPNNGEDISIYKVFASPESTLSLVTSLASDGSSSLNVHKDYNTPINIVPISSSDALICKEDEICLLDYVGGTNPYQGQSKLVAENNFFMNGVSFGVKKFVLNAVSNGIEVLDVSSDPESKISLGFQAHHICMDNDGDKLYIYNKLSAYEAGCYIYDFSSGQPTLANINSFGGPGNEVTAPIGDCIYNPFQDHFLISENGYFENRAASVLVFRNKIYNNNPNTIYTSLNLSHNGTSSYFAKDMFISPDGILYVFADMNYDNTKHPKVFAFSANDPSYTLIAIHDLDVLPFTWPIPDVYFDFYRAHFCYNPHNNKVYATVDPQLYTMSPYNTTTNATFDPYSVLNDINTGLLIEFDQGQITNSKYLNFPGKIICPDNGNPDAQSQYGEKLYVIGPRFYEIDTPYFDFPSPINITNQAFNDITYCPKNDKMYVLADEAYVYPPPIPNPPPPPTYRMINAYSIETNESGQTIISDEPILEEGGQATCIFHNPHDGYIYIHQKTDEDKFGVTPVRLLSFNPEDDPVTISTTDLDVNSLYPELDHNDNGIFAFFYYNITTPCINPYNNTMYIPNGGHSCVSKVTFNANEALRLQDGAWSWVSFPRMESDNNESMEVQEVLGENISPDIDEFIIQTGSNLQYKNPVLGPQTSYYDIIEKWDDELQGSNLPGVQSTLGYKLFLKYDDNLQVQPDEKWLFMQGSLYDLNTHLDPNCSSCPLPMNIQGVSEYWAGYYHPVSQNIPDALPDEIESKVHIVKGQYFTCYSEENQTDGITWRCVCNKGSAMLNYGDMAIITLKPNETIDNFYWAYYNNVPVTEEKDETEYYTYTETSDYTPIFIELDTNANPLEIGAFVNDSCIGGTCVLPEDTVVMIATYSDSLSGEIYFEEYYGSSKNYQPPIYDYFVKEPGARQSTQRLIHTRENHEYYIVSLKNDNSNQSDEKANSAWIRCIPNPADENSQIKSYIPMDAYTEIVLFNIMGNKQLTVYSGILNEGTHTFSFRDHNNLANGTYILSLKASSFSANSKMILIK